MLRTIFAGTPSFALPALAALLAHRSVQLVAVYSQPDRAAGRGLATQASPVKQAALAAGLPVLSPATWRSDEVIDEFASLRPDLFVVAAYGIILPARALSIPRHGTLNVHASLLPRWRGAAPVQRAIMAGDAETGVTIMRVVPELDAGPMLLRRACPILGEDTAGTLLDRVARLGAGALADAIDLLQTGRLEETPQDPSAVTYAAKIERADRALDWQAPAAVLARRIRALHPSPLATADVGGVTVSVRAAHALPAQAGAPGSVLSCTAQGVDVATADGVLRVTELQPPGKRSMSAADFCNGYGRRLRA